RLGRRRGVGPARRRGPPKDRQHLVRRRVARVERQVPQQRRHRPVLGYRSEEHTSELQSLRHLVCRLLLEKKKESVLTLLTSWYRYWPFATCTPSRAARSKRASGRPKGGSWVDCASAFRSARYQIHVRRFA